MPPTRDPFPYPRYENDVTFSGEAPCLQRAPYSKPTHLSQDEDPWSRLNATATLSSARREVYYFDPEAPNDNLDFNLKGLYNHQTDLLKNKNEVIFQKETFHKDHGRILKNRVKEIPPSSEHRKYMVREWMSPRKENIHCIEGAIESHHTATTNRGYSRKDDGGFYSI
uniref:Protein C1orf194 homolog n=1 Tax=Geotrypetes seraphini TaxID=260995 RepID=A0A6P8P0Y4_GEOSA|nr:protein C1orf194 homolog [Geotrypetes seraphini]